MLKPRLLILLFFVLFSTAGSYAQENKPDSALITSSTEKSQPSVGNNAEPLPPALGDIYKPTIGFGMGMMSFYGDLYKKHAQPFENSRVGYEFTLSQPLNKYLYLNFYTLFGKLGANERLGYRNENFQSEIRMGGVHLMYDFSNFFKTDKYLWRPWISTGIEGFEFLSKTDLKDKNGNTYYYWSDGSIKNVAENSPDAGNAINLVRDYNYETDIRERNADGFGKYQERSWAVPLGVGFSLKVTDRATFRMGTTFHLTFTDYIDGITNKSIGDRAGTKAKDKFVMSSFSLHYDLVTKRKLDTLPDDWYNNVDMLVFDNDDEDGDGVTDFKDDCHKTPAGVKVDSKGCPVDEDKDLIADYYDEELPTPEGMIANGVGVGITDEYAQWWYDFYYDSTGVLAKSVDLDSASRNEIKIDPNSLKKNFTVELARYKGGVPSDVMAYLLSVGDVESTTIGDETIVFTAGSYDDIRSAIARRDEFHNEGIVKDAKVAYFQGGVFYELTDEQLKAEETNATGDISEVESKDPNAVIYRVQLGAYKHPLSASLFKHVGKVIELRTGDGYYKYVTEAYPTLERAMIAKADVILEGYSDAFVAAYKGGKRIGLVDAGATFENKNDAKKEVLDESKNIVNAIDKSLVTFHVQIGALKKSNDQTFEERVKDIKGIDKMQTTTGLVRYIVGAYNEYNKAVEEKGKLAEEGFSDAFVIATFKGEVISIQEALEILGSQNK